ncbi:hypothetical protein MKZ38_009694 [Zalerion maritima]|uniref:AMP-dependent synthetase/ligase domain-containing protein n=1 Tax=Zalerion maritima TaxID=339359 RepID=A0AAD5WNH4_9PEZI|nr:hypothetical protein MKZ38_009694 [Zalerion maritima]
MRPLSRKNNRAEAHGATHPEEDLQKSFRLLFEDTVEKYPTRVALISLWQDGAELQAFGGANGCAIPKKDSAAANEAVPLPCASATASDASSRSPTPGGRQSTPVSTRTTQSLIQWTYEYLNFLSNTTATCLQSHGCMPGDTLVTFLWNSAEWAIFFWAAAKVGMTFVPLDPRTLPPGTDVQYLLETTKPAAIVVQDGDSARILDETLAAAAAKVTPAHLELQHKHKLKLKLKLKVCCSETSPPGWVIAQDAIASVEPVAVAPNRPQILHELSATSEDSDNHDDKTGNSCSLAEQPTERDGPWESKVGSSFPSGSAFISTSAGSSSDSAPLPALSSDPSAMDNPATTISGSTTSAPSLIVFTSGTTALPKGCPHTPQSLWSQSFDYDPHPTPGLVDKWLVHTPVSHIFAVNNCLRAWRYGHAVVFPSKSFDVTASLRALTEEKCTFMAAVPTLTRALLGHPEFPTDATECLRLRYVTMGGTLIREEDVKLCKDALGAETVIQAYGMSEGAPIVSWRRSDPLLDESGYHPGVGKVLPGAKVRVCRPGTKNIVEKGEVGELHIGGVSVIKQYLNDKRYESFYQDDQGHWLTTGDQVVMDQDEVLHVHGRYKDLIIRAGENINPVKIEAALNSNIAGIATQVVGAPDGVSGEVPIAVVESRGRVDKSLIAKTALSLGKMYALGGILSLGDLGIDSFPMTASGKARKQTLKELVVTFLSSNALIAPAPSPRNEEAGDGHKSCGTSPQEVTITNTHRDLSASEEARADECLPNPESVTKVYDGDGNSDHGGTCDGSCVYGASLPGEELTNSMSVATTSDEEVPIQDNKILSTIQDIILQLTHAKVGIDDDLGHSGDSITVLRYCDRVLNQLGVRLHIRDFAENRTLRQQADLISRRQAPGVELSNIPVSSVLGAPDLGDDDTSDPLVSVPPGIISFGISSTPPRGYLPGVRECISLGSNCLDELGLSSDDVEDILPIKSILHRFAAGQRFQSYSNRVGFKMKEGITVSAVRQAVESAISIRQMFRTALIKEANKTAFHIVLRPSETLFNRLVSVVDVKTEEERKDLLEDESPQSFPLPLTAQAVVISVQESGLVYLRMTLNHTVFDAVSLMPFYMDLDKLLNCPDWKPPAMIPFKLFSDLLSMYSTSLPAIDSAAFHVKRLRGISHHASSLFPKQKAPGWMISSDSTSPHFAARESVRKSIWSDWESSKEEFRFPRFGKIINLPALLSLQDSHDIKAPILMKAAVALLNMAVTGEDVALFTMIEHGRSWPFVPDWMQKTLPHIMSVDGPTLEWVLNMTNLPAGRSRRRKAVTVRQWLGQLAEEQNEIQRHVHAPWEAILEGLGDEAEVAIDATFRQTLVWDVSLPLLNMAGDYKKMVPIGRYDWADRYVFPPLFFLDRNITNIDLTINRSGLLWNACHLDKSNLFLVASWDTAQMNDRQVNSLAEGLADILRRLCNLENLDASVTDLLDQHLSHVEEFGLHSDLG